MNFEKLQDIANVIDSLHKTPQYSETGYSMVRCTDVKYGFLNLQGTLKVSKDIFDEFSRRYTPSLNDIVITRVGTYGITALVQDVEFCLGQNTSVIIAKNINPKYLYVVLNSPILKYQIEASVVGSTQKTLSLKAINSLEIPRFSPKVEDRIAKIISELDDKLYLNNQINQTLESIAQAIFKSWFIDFEPVKAKRQAKIEGKDPELAAMCAISGKSGAELEQMAADDFAELQATAALFPDELVESELGEVPKRWEVTNINAVTKSIFSGGTPSTKETAYWNGEIPWLSSGETRNKIIVSTEKSITELAVNKSSTKQAIYGDILIASAGQGHTRGQTSFNGMSCYINQSIVALRANDRISGYWLYYCLEPRYDEMRSLSDSHSSRGSLTTKLLASMPVILPTKELIVSFDKLVKQMFGQQLNNYKEIKTLADMRNALLPKLLLGELEILT